MIIKCHEHVISRSLPLCPRQLADDKCTPGLGLHHKAPRHHSSLCSSFNPTKRRDYIIKFWLIAQTCHMHYVTWYQSPFFYQFFRDTKKEFLYQTQSLRWRGREGVRGGQHISISGMTFTARRIIYSRRESIKCVIISPVVVVVSN